MRNKFVPLAVALLFASIALVGFSKMNGVAPQEETVEIYVAARTIEALEEVKEDAVMLKHWPAKNIPEDAIQSWYDLKGKFIAQRIFDGEPVLARKLVESDKLSGWIPEGFTTIDLNGGEANGISNLVQPGDYVNVMGSFRKRDIVTETTTRTVLSGIRVYAVDGRTSREEKTEEETKTNVKVVSLVMHPEDAKAWIWAKELGTVSLILGRPDQSSIDESGPNRTGQEFLAWLSSLQQPKEHYTVVVCFPHDKDATAPEVEHRMVKAGPDGQTVLYTWEQGNPVPIITTTVSPAGPYSSPVAGTAAGRDLGFSTGENSQLLSDPANDVSVDNPDYK